MGSPSLRVSSSMRPLLLVAGYHLGKKALPIVSEQVGDLMDRHAPKLAQALGRKPASPLEKLLRQRLSKRDSVVNDLIRSLPRSDWKIALRQWGLASAAHHLLRPRLGFLGSLGQAALDAWIVEQRVEAVKTFGTWVARRSAMHAGKKATQGVREKVADFIRPRS
jgi:hypothetical protein